MRLVLYIEECPDFVGCLIPRVLALRFPFLQVFVAAYTSSRIVSTLLTEAAVMHCSVHPNWNSEAGRVSGIIIKKITSNASFKGYTHHASREAPQYLIKSDKTDHLAIHKGTALRLVPAPPKKSGKTSTK
jgi:hypothetical protein